MFASFMLVVGALSLALVRPVSAETDDPGQRIVEVAKRSLHLQEGQCFPWVRRVVQEATGRTMGFGYRDGYLSGGAIEVPLADVRAGDILQIADDANHGPGVSYPGLHTAIVMHRQADGLLTVIDSNSQWDGIVRIREDYDPQAAAARYPNLNVRAYRFSDVVEAPTEATQLVAFTPGATARINGDGDCVNLRAEPRLSGAKITCVADGSFVEVLDSEPVQADGYTWRHVQTGWGAGWMADDFLVALAAPSGTPTPTPSPTPTATPTPTSTPPSQTPVSGTAGTLTGSLPTGGGPGIVLWSGGPVEGIVTQAVAGGCSLTSVWSTVNGQFVGYTAGAPAFVNASWRQHYPGDLRSMPLILICRQGGDPGAGSTPPPSGGTPPSAPQDGAPPGPAGNED